MPFVDNNNEKALKIIGDFKNQPNKVTETEESPIRVNNGQVRNGDEFEELINADGENQLAGSLHPPIRNISNKNV